MAFGLTSQGFVTKRLADIKAEIEADLRIAFGSNINLLPQSIFGQLVGIFAERESLIWELAEQVYNSQYPDSAEAIQLDKVVAITGIVRKQASLSRIDSQIFFGTIGTLIPAGTELSVNGSPSSIFQTDNPVVLIAGQNAIQNISAGAVPDGGSFTLGFDEETTSNLTFSATNTDIQNALNALNALSGVVVTGDFSTGFVVTFAGDDGLQSQSIISIATNTLTDGGSPVSLSVIQSQAGVPQGQTSMTATEVGAKQALTGTLTEIDSPIGGLDSTKNIIDADVGQDDETDAELKARRENELQVAGRSTIDAIRSRILAINDVTAVVVFQNIYSIPDIDGRPPHSVDIVVQNGDEQEIADEIFDSVAAGIETIGDITKTVFDSQNFSHPIKFSRPTDVPIFIELDLTTDNDIFPDDGINQVLQSILTYGGDLSIGDDVIIFGSDPLACAWAEIPGILDFAIRISRDAGPPSTDDNIIISPREIADFQSGNITIVEL